MLKTLKLENYRGYDEHEIDLRELTIVVGKNNAGKSTLIEALRLISLVTNRYKTAPYRSVPSWLGIPLVNTGVSPSLQRIDFSYENIYHSYGDPPAIITAVFLNNTKVKIYFAGEKRFHAVLFDNKGNVCSKTGLANLDLPIINILPQISPLISDEKVLNEEYVRLNVDSPTSSRHFRNQLNYLKQHYKKFKNLIEETWEGLRILEYNAGNRIEEKNPYLLIQEGVFTTEISMMGHGLQMWMQTMWFLARCNSNSTVILDEPDVYMHADLQRKLIRLLRNEFNQVVIATHSIEIMSEVEPESILVIDRNKSKSIFASDFNAVQKVLLNIGSIHNIALARLWSARKFLIVEGKDIDILKRLQNTLFKNSSEPFDAIPQMSIGGWGGWSRAIGSKIMLKNAGDEDIITYCILDSDYYEESEIADRYSEAKKNDINLKVWKRKELENYLISPQAIKRIIEKGSNKRVSENSLIEKINECCESLKEEFVDLTMDRIHVSYRRKGNFLEPSSARKKAEKKVDEIWTNKLERVSGKTLIKKISAWTNDEFNVSINPLNLAQELRADEIPQEMKAIITRIEKKQKF
ncbi:ATP-dependent nuclease [Roseivirga pacifica]|uniref:ATP-dependent nuclease n=1 Tax=Roseivirga pacifica TaxID=1267423 RepID=UPI00227A459B|nr:ATP-binding protein [Roseivirga pacifica]